MSESQWDKAARNAAEECFLSDWRYVGIIEPIIAKSHADLRATYDALTKLAEATREAFNNRGAVNLCRTMGMSVNPEWIDKANEAEKVIGELLTDPLVQAAIERSKG